MQIPILFVTETHLDPSFSDEEIEIPGYAVLRQDRPGRGRLPVLPVKRRRKGWGQHEQGGLAEEGELGATEFWLQEGSNWSRICDIAFKT